MRVLDLTNHVCPMTYVMLKATLEETANNETLFVLLYGKDTLRDIVASLHADGYAIQSVNEQQPEQFQLIVTTAQNK